jgi:cell division protein FtsI/penicillin-binding protein 2
MALGTHYLARKLGQLLFGAVLCTRAGAADPVPAEPPGKVRLPTVRLVDGQGVATLSDGSRAKLTLDAELQHAAGRLLAAAHPVSGAIVAIEVATGNVLVLESYRRKGARPGNPLVLGAPSASLFKLVTTTALFEHTDVEPSTRVCFLGGERSIEREHLEPPHDPRARCAPFKIALGHSWNAVYAQLATQDLMRDQLLQTADNLGFNHDLDFDVEASFGSLDLPYNDLQFARAAAGFVGSTFTPLGAAQLTYGIALGGRPARMRLVAESGDYVAPHRRQYLDRMMSANAAWRLTRMMEVTVSGGTSLMAFSKEDGSSYLGGVRVAGKTGTLQRDDESPTTSWFTGFAPSRKPRIVVTVMLENGQVWREKANQVARDLLRVYFAGAPGVDSPFD